MEMIFTMVKRKKYSQMMKVSYKSQPLLLKALQNCKTIEKLMYIIALHRLANIYNNLARNSLQKTR